MTTGPGPSPAPPGSGGVKAQMLWHAVRRHPIVVLLLVLLAGGVSAGVWFFLPLPKLTGVAVFHVAAQPLTILATTGDNHRGDFRTFKDMQAAVVKQRLVLN